MHTAQSRRHMARAHIRMLGSQVVTDVVGMDTCTHRNFQTMPKNVKKSNRACSARKAKHEVLNHSGKMLQAQQLCQSHHYQIYVSTGQHPNSTKSANTQVRRAPLTQPTQTRDAHAHGDSIQRCSCSKIT